jgi:hypothetical protein
VTIKPGSRHRRGDRLDQVRNGNRWRSSAHAEMESSCIEQNHCRARVLGFFS